MCTSFKYKTFMGRNYDYDQSYNETITNIPKQSYGNKYTIIGICTGAVKERPLLYDGMNEYGLCCSALAFTGNATYNKYMDGKYNKPSYDFVFNILSEFKTVEETKEYLDYVNITDDQYNEQMPPSDLHWFICDKEQAITVEPGETLNVYENKHFALTNNPPFPKQTAACNMQDTTIGVYDELPMEYMSRGMETIGLPGDLTSMGRFQRISYYLKKSCHSKFNDNMTMFHLLDTVKQPYGATPVGDGYEYTIYSASYDMTDLKLMVKPYGSLNIIQCNMNNDKEWRMTI